MIVKPYPVVRSMKADPLTFARNAQLVDDHSEQSRKMIGAWRWVAIERHGDLIKQIVTKGRTIDLGGAAGPIGYGAVVVDYQNPHNRTSGEAAPRALWDVEGKVDCVFSSHTLEHLVDVENALVSITHKLNPGGHLIIQVPSWSKDWLHPENWPGHYQTFCLSYETNAPDSTIRLDTWLGEHGYVVQLAEVIDLNILVIAQR